MSSETLENVAGWIAGIATGFALTVLFIAMEAPVAETLRKFIA